MKMTDADFSDIIDEFERPALDDQNCAIPTFDEVVPQALDASETCSEATLKNTPNIVTRYLLNIRNHVLDEEIKPNPIRDEYFQAISKASRLSKSVLLETFNPFHMECAEVLINIFYKIKLHDLKKAIEYAKTKINPHLLNYALSVALRHREDTVQGNVQIPSHVCTTPGMYFDINTLNNKFHNKKTKRDVEERKKPLCIDVGMSFTATDMDPEHRVAYFREDIGANLHHRHWHEVYPVTGMKEIVEKDRRGELFYYMHQQMLARYNFERLSNGLHRTEPYSDLRAPIAEAYFPKLDTATNTKLWNNRQAHTSLKDLRRDGMFYRLDEMERWRNRIFEAIDRGYAYVRNPDGTETLKKLEEPEAINELGNTIEAVSALSWNFRYYGDFHNKGHLIISRCHDPDNRFKELPGVMSFNETAMRDPIFYRWHTHIDDIFQHYKRTLPPYTYEERYFPGIEIEDVQVVLENKPEESKNIFKTYWQKDAVDITQGILNLKPEKDGHVFAVFTHLQHENFVYQIQVNNTNQESYIGTVRIFIAPKNDESGMEMIFNKQRRFFIELDKFTTTLKPGTNTIERNSSASSVTIPFKQSFMTTSDAKLCTNDEELRKSMLSYCGCGWPQHLLIGKGNAAGFPCVLFVMVTDFRLDKVDDSDPIKRNDCCVKSAISFCGLRDKKYPDSRAMGFPFDRNIDDADATINEFLTKSQLSRQQKNEKGILYCEDEAPLSNMKVIDVEVKFEDNIVPGPSLPECYVEDTD